jgi:pimeloyl-ACP methyl ester carboxylesterase
VIVTPSSVRWTPTDAQRSVDLDGLGVPLRLAERNRERPFLLLHGGAGPASVRGFGDLLAARWRARVLTPTHPGFDGTPRPEAIAGMRDLARLYVRLLDDMDVWDVTVIGNSIGGWLAAEIGLLGSPRVGGVVVLDAVGLEVPGHPVTDVSGLTPQDLMRLSFHDPARFAPDPSAPGPSPELVQANMGSLFFYGGATMTDPTLGERLRHMPVPVHVIWGAADGIVGPEHGRAWADALPEAHLTVLAQAGHLPQLESPERLLGAMQDLGASPDRGAAPSEEAA